jgi:hypothetical protein
VGSYFINGSAFVFPFAEKVEVIHVPDVQLDVPAPCIVIAFGTVNVSFQLQEPAGTVTVPPLAVAVTAVLTSARLHDEAVVAKDGEAIDKKIIINKSIFFIYNLIYIALMQSIYL